MKKCLIISLLTISIFSFNASAIGPVDISVDFVSSYIWRGFDFNPDKKPALQPSVTFNFGKTGLSFNLWSSISFEKKERFELDLTIDYTTKLSDMLSLSAGFIHYGNYLANNFEFKDNTTQEFYASTTFNTILSPTLSFYVDVNNGSGLYTLLGIGHSFQILKDTLNIDLSASLGLNIKSWINDSGFSDLNFGIAAPIKASSVIIKPHATLTLRLMDEVKNFAGSGDDAIFWFGLSISL